MKYKRKKIWCILICLALVLWMSLTGYAETANSLLSQEQAIPGTFVLTGEVISDQMQNAIKMLNDMNDMSTEELMLLPEVQWAEQNMRSGSSVDELSQEELEDRQKEAIDFIMGLGSYSGKEKGIDGKNHDVYNGAVRQEKRLDVVIGPPAAGKSSVAVNPISAANGSRVLDPDMFKELKPEYQGGLNSNYVHIESRNNMIAARDMAIANGDNLVLPTVGYGYSYLLEDLQPYRDAGYEVYLHLVDLDYRKAMGRMLNRYMEDGRYIPPSYLNDLVKNNPRDVYEQMKQEEWIRGYEHIDNDVPRNTPARIVESHGLGEDQENF